MSCLYFRGKIAYAKQFASPPLGWTGSGTYIITPGFGLVPPDWNLNAARMRRLQQTPVDPKSRAYREPLEDHSLALAERIGQLDREAKVVLLGSIATGKYIDLLWPIFQERLRSPIVRGIGDRAEAPSCYAPRSGQELDMIRSNPSCSSVPQGL